MNTLKQFKSWIATQPWRAITYLALFVIIPATIAIYEELKWPLLGLFTFCLLMWSLSMWQHCKRYVTIILCLAVINTSVSFLPSRAQEAPPKEAAVDAVPVAVGVLVICVGGYCAYKAAKFCQKHFPKGNGQTNSVMFLAQGDGDEYGASYNYGSAGSCGSWEGDFAPADDGSHPITMTINVWVGYNNDVNSQVVAMTGENTYQDFIGFQNEAASHGLRVSGSADGSQYFSLNRIPCDASAIPLRFDQDTKEVVHDIGGALRTVIVERSSDLINWSAFMRVATSEGSSLQVIDTTNSERMFYRVRLL